jgi:hypothetical protein
MDGGSIPPGSTILAAETMISDRRQSYVYWTLRGALNRRLLA